MQFLVYLTVLMVSVSTVLLEIHWLTTPAPQPKPAAQASAPPRPMVESPNANLSPVYPKKLEPVRQVETAPTVQNDGQKTLDAAAAADTTKAETIQKPVAETTGAAPRSVDSSKDGGTSKSASAPPENAQAYAAPAKQKQKESDQTAASSNRCDVQACTSAYKSFRAADCTYQPMDGPRRVCGKAAEQRAAREQRDEPQRRSWSQREDSRESTPRESDRADRRTRWRVYDEDDDDADDAFLFRRSRRW